MAAAARFFSAVSSSKRMVGWLFLALAFAWMASADAHATREPHTDEVMRGGALMTADERRHHVARLRDMRSFDECRVYLYAHSLEIDRRAFERRTPLPPVADDPCEIMKSMGRFR